MPFRRSQRERRRSALIFTFFRHRNSPDIISSEREARSGSNDYLIVYFGRLVRILQPFENGVSKIVVKRMATLIIYMRVHERVSLSPVMSAVNVV